MTVQPVLDDLRRDPQFMANVMAWQTLPKRRAETADMPATLHPVLAAALRVRGIQRLYSHQAESVACALRGEDVTVVTPTASGKTLCYNLPVLHSLLTDPAARALYLFPTKALAQDQLAELARWQGDIEAQRARSEERSAPTPQDCVDPRSSRFDLSVSTYDGDTPTSQRSAIRRQTRLILTNPDMLHVGILPYHPNWAAFLGGLRYVVIDEMHVYRGVFGSHMANVLRRLQRICALYGSRPQFICASATIANPGALAERLIERPVAVMARNGAPSGEKHIILYNPPITDAERGLRRSSTLEAQALATRCLLGGAQTIVFARSRLVTEVLLSYLQERMPGERSEEQRMAILEQRARAADQETGDAEAASRSALLDPRASIRGYRGGYLPRERRAIEAGLRDGTVRGVVATNALELGIDIGQLQAAILCGYPGSIASTWQQMGRSGRTQEASLAILIATSGVLDQYVAQHPEFLFEQSPEHAFINPDNLMLLVDQVRCAAFELPFQAGETFGACTFTEDVLQLLAEEGEIHPSGGRFFWQGAGYPAQQVSLRSAGSERVVIQAQHPEGVRVIGEIDRASAPLLVHAGAIYLHEGQSYLVERLNMEEGVASVRPSAVDFYTEVTSETRIEVLAEQEQRETAHVRLAHGEVRVSTRPTGFRRIKRFTHETLAVEPLDFAPDEVETNGYWFGILPAAQMRLAAAGRWFDSVNDYGPEWQAHRGRVRLRDGYRCTQCGAPESPGREHDVHHLIPFRTFGYIAGLNRNDLLANRLDNLVLVCRHCHRRLESSVRTRTGLDGVAYAIAHLAPLHLMCDRSDLGVAVDRGSPLKADAAASPLEAAARPDAHGAELRSSLLDPALPTVTLYERVPAGLGFSARLFELHDPLLAAAEQLIERCGCPTGCPACVGPVLDNESTQLPTKALALDLLQVLRAAP